MRYELNTQYDIEQQDIIGHGVVFSIRKGHRDDILILDEPSQALIRRTRQQGMIDDTIEDASILARLANEGILTPLTSSGASHTQPYAYNLNFWLQVTDACNLACRYCYIPSLNSKQVFNPNLFDLLTRKLLTVNGLRTVNIKLAGGEPLVAFKKWRAGIIQLRQVLADHGIALQLRLITNLTMLTDAMISFIRDNAIAISVSLDGLVTYHDKNRIFPSTQKGTFEIVDKNIKRLKAAGITPSVMVTVTSDNHKGIPDLVEYLVKNDLTFHP